MMTFREMHRPGDPLVLANAWDVGSARMLVALGATAIGTTSAGYAFTRGAAEVLEESFSWRPCIPNFAQPALLLCIY